MPVVMAVGNSSAGSGQANNSAPAMTAAPATPTLMPIVCSAVPAAPAMRRQNIKPVANAGKPNSDISGAS